MVERHDILLSFLDPLGAVGEYHDTASNWPHEHTCHLAYLLTERLVVGSSRTSCVALELIFLTINALLNLLLNSERLTAQFESREEESIVTLDVVDLAAFVHCLIGLVLLAGDVD